MRGKYNMLLNVLRYTCLFAIMVLGSITIIACGTTNKEARYYFNRGFACYERGQLVQAISNFTKCIDLNPKKWNLSKAYYNRGLAYHDNGQLDQAISDYTKAIELNPRHFKAYNNRGNVYSSKKEYDKAISDFNKSIEMDPINALVYCNRGNAYARKKEYDKAISDYTKAIEIDPGDAIAYRNRGLAYHDKGQLDQAISDYNRAIEIDPGDALIYNNRGFAYAQKGQYDKAISDYNKTIELNPDAIAYNRLAWLLATCPEGRYRNSVKAIEYAKKAVELEKTSGFLDTLAAAYAENGDFTNAVKAEEEAVRLCNDPKIKKEFQELVEAYQSKKTYVQFKNSNKEEAWAALIAKYPERVEGLEVGETDLLIARVQDERKKPGDTCKDPMTGMEFIWVPGGCFKMGSNDGDPDERPVHEVCVDGFWIGKYEVTQGQWKKVIGNNPSKFKKGENYPVERVSWNDVKKFIQKLNYLNNDQFIFRLPTEAEWEYACRSGGKDEKYAGGNDFDRVAWYSNNSRRTAHPVGQKVPNGLGVYDTSGNVWEWCEDIDNAYSQHHQRNNPIYTSGGSFRVIRGGSWNISPRYVRCANRGSRRPDFSDYSLGFRLVRTD